MTLNNFEQYNKSLHLQAFIRRGKRITIDLKI